MNDHREGLLTLEENLIGVKDNFLQNNILLVNHDIAIIIAHNHIAYFNFKILI